jgi:carotenoid cleavage dioxygenase-like enzyme
MGWRWSIWTCLKWPVAVDLAGSDLPCRLEGEVAGLVVLGEIPKEINGTFYRVMVDPFVAPDPRNVPLDGDGNISAFRFHEGRVDMKMRYIETERYKLERKAGKALFGLYRNPFTHHPCVRAAVDSTANTNLVYWAGHLLALKEVALPYAVDPDTLDTIKYDPFGDQVKSKTFTAHPKVDPMTNELVVYGYEAKDLATLDIVTYALDAQGRKTEEFWLKSPWCGIIHDCAITTNFIVLFIWPFEASIERMKAGGHHWAWNYERPATFIVVPRRPGRAAKYGWRDGEHRVYTWKNCWRFTLQVHGKQKTGRFMQRATWFTITPSPFSRLRMVECHLPIPRLSSFVGNSTANQLAPPYLTQVWSLTFLRNFLELMKGL